MSNLPFFSYLSICIISFVNYTWSCIFSFVHRNRYAYTVVGKYFNVWLWLYFKPYMNFHTQIRYFVTSFINILTYIWLYTSWFHYIHPFMYSLRSHKRQHPTTYKYQSTVLYIQKTNKLWILVYNYVPCDHNVSLLVFVCHHKKGHLSLLKTEGGRSGWRGLIIFIRLHILIELSGKCHTRSTLQAN